MQVLLNIVGLYLIMPFWLSTHKSALIQHNHHLSISYTICAMTKHLVCPQGALSY